MSLKQYNIEAYATHTIITENSVLRVGQKMPSIMTQEIIEKYKKFMNIINCEEIKVDKAKENIKPKRQYKKKQEIVERESD